MQILTYHGCNHEGFQDDLGDDHPPGSKWQDIWGTVWHKPHNAMMGMPVGCPLQETTALEHYTWPDPDDERIFGRIFELKTAFAASGHYDGFLAGLHRDLLWEKAYMLGGMEEMMMRFITEPEFMQRVLRRIMDFQLGIARHYVKAGVELVKFTDDLGGQHGPLLGPRIFNRFIKPQYQRIFDFYKSRGVLVFLHSCGNIESLIDDYIELGVNILNPVQATANDLVKVREMTQGRIALEGAVNSDIVLNGPVSRIEEEVKMRMIQLGRHGGYFCCPDQKLPYPQEHLDALHSMVKRFGRYPLDVDAMNSQHDDVQANLGL